MEWIKNVENGSRHVMGRKADGKEDHLYLVLNTAATTRRRR